jgi:molecular chaperone GrpE (heat shock protein)
MMKNFFLFACAALAATFCTEINSFAIGNRYFQKSATLFPNFKQIHAFREYALLMSAADNETDIDDTDAVSSTLEDDVVTVDAEDVTNEIEEEEPVVVELDPYAVAVKDLEAQLKIDISLLEATLKSDRNSLSKTKDKASESGKNGYFIVQAKVAEYQKNKAVEQKTRVTKNKREFVMKMLPVVDAFRAAPIISPPTTDREISMHKSFGSLLESILVVFEKYGFKEYDAGERMFHYV